MTHELLFGVEHELMRNFGVSANVTWRKYDELQLAAVRRRERRRLHADGHV